MPTIEELRERASQARSGKKSSKKTKRDEGDGNAIQPASTKEKRAEPPFAAPKLRLDEAGNAVKDYGGNLVYDVFRIDNNLWSYSPNPSGPLWLYGQRAKLLYNKTTGALVDTKNPPEVWFGHEGQFLTVSATDPRAIAAWKLANGITEITIRNGETENHEEKQVA